MQCPTGGWPPPRCDLTVWPARASLCTPGFSAEKGRVHGGSMGRDLAREIAELPALNKAQLLPIWRRNFDQDPPPTLRKELMVPILAYRMQEKEFGGLSHGARKRLREIAKSLGPEKRAQPSIARSIRSGTRLI